jgi:hypothetical protein
MTLLVLTEEVPGSKTKFVCFLKCMHERYTGHERVRVCCFTADGSAKSRKLTLVSMSLSSMKSNLRRPTLFISELGPVYLPHIIASFAPSFEITIKHGVWIWHITLQSADYWVMEWIYEHK